MWAALRFRDFRLLIGGRFVAQIGEMMVSVAIGWELYERTRDPLALGLVGLVQVIPVIFLALIGGYVADRYGSKWVTLWSQGALALLSLMLVVLSVTQGSLLLIYLVLTGIGVARAFNNPAESALTPQTVPPEHFTNAMAWSSSVWQTSAITGPAIGGGIIALTNSAAAVYLLNALAGGVLILVLLLLRSEQRGYADAGEPPLEALKEGLRFVRDKKVILASITLDMFAVLLGGVPFLLPIFAQDILQVDAAGLGLLRAAPSVGALAMAFYLTRAAPFEQAGKTLLWAVAGFGAATVVFGLSQNFWLSLVMLALTGALDNISVVIRGTLIMTQTPDAMRGRVGAVNMIFIGMSNELGGFRSGVTAALLGAVGSTVVGGIGTMLVVGLVAWFSPEIRTLQRLTDAERKSKHAA
jgi:MFS family permease